MGIVRRWTGLLLSLLPLMLLGLGLGLSATASAHTVYRVIHLGPGQIATYPHINARGQVAYSLIHDGRTAGFFHDGVAARAIGSLGGVIVYVNGLNDAGQVVGTALDASGVENAFVWSLGGGMLDLRAAPGGGRSYGWAINRRGVVTGAFGDAARPFRWSHAGGVEDLGATPAVPAPSSGQVLNDAGLIAGVTLVDDETTRAFAWTRAGGLVDIDTLGSIESSPVAVGAGGEVAGNRYAAPDDGGDHPFLWTPAGGMVDLGTGPGTSAWVSAMTPDLHIAGGIGYPDGHHRAMSWTRHGGMRALGTLGGRTSSARAVNARGQVVGFAEDRGGAMRAFVWSAQGGMLDLNRRLRHAPPGLLLEHALAINDGGAIVASSNAGLVLLRPDDGRACRHGCGHVLGPLAGPDSVEVGAPLALSFAFVDGDRAGTRSVELSWGDGSAGPVRASVDGGGVGRVSASHGFAAPGRYTLTATVVDRAGRRTAVSREVEVTAPRAGSAPSNT